MGRLMIVEVHVIIESNLLKQALGEIVEILRKVDKQYYGLIPLYVNYDIEDTEARVCLQIEDPVELEKFIVEKIRKVRGIYETRVRLTLNGEIFPKGMNVLTSMDVPPYSCHIFINTNPERDEYVWKSLQELKEDNQVLPVWIFRDFYEYGHDITLRLIGQNDKLIRKYVENHIANINGIRTWKLKFMYNVVQILERDELFKIAQNWFNLQKK